MAKFSRLDIGYLITIAALCLAGFIFSDISGVIAKFFSGIIAVYFFFKTLDVYKTDKIKAAMYAFVVVITTALFALNVYNLINP